jgi:hypothetical protein
MPNRYLKKLFQLPGGSSSTPSRQIKNRFIKEAERNMPDIPLKRRRGGQHGNQNAKGNRGNPHPRPNYGNRGGRGAPRGNQYARRKPLLPHEIFIRDYPEFQEWFLNHAAEVNTASITLDDQRDPALYSAHKGLTLDRIVEEGLEYTYGCFTIPEDLLESAVDDANGAGSHRYLPPQPIPEERLSQGC